MKSNLKFKFITSIWITGNFNGEYVIGRTCMLDGQKTLAIVTESGALQLVLFDSVQSPKKLTIINNTKPRITTSFFQKPKITASEKLIIDALNSINN
jgi:hypothetical protein